MKKFLWSLAACAALALPTQLFAQDAAVASAEPEDPNTGALTLSGGIDYTTAYFFRGYNQEDTGLIVQPYVTVTANLVTNDQFTLNAYVGTWNSLHEHKTGSTGSNGAWYENDVYGGLDLVFGKFTVGAVYTFYTYPNGAFDTIQELGFKVAYDDTEVMRNVGVNFALKPYVGVYIETQDGNGTEDIYGEIGLAPSFAVGNGITLTVPLVLGLSIDDYYVDDDGDNELLGYGSIGAFASLPLGEAGRYGAWTLTGGVQYIYLFADSAEAANDGGENDELLGKVGVSFTY